MERHLDRNIKDVIAEYPRVGAILAEHGIGCSDCAIGTCLLREIIEVHGLSVEEEREVMRRIAAVISPGHESEVSIPERGKRRQPGVGSARKGSLGASPPIKRLMDEHSLILRLLALVPWMCERLSAGPSDSAGAADDARRSLDFIRTFADRYHHAKEEDILFGYFDSATGIIATMRQEHDVARSHVREAAECLQKGQFPAAAARLTAYRALLVEHIRKEDEILYPYLDSRLSLSQVGDMFSRFAEVERDFGDAPRLLEEMIVEMEGRRSRAQQPLAALAQNSPK